METSGDDKRNEQPNLKDEGWSAPAAQQPGEDTKVASRLKTVTILLVIFVLIALVGYLFYSRA